MIYVDKFGQKRWLNHRIVLGCHYMRWTFLALVVYEGASVDTVRVFDIFRKLIKSTLHAPYMTVDAVANLGI